MTRKERALVIRPRKDGFTVAAGPGAAKWSFPTIVDIRVAYDILDDDPFKRHSKFDFDFSEDEINVEVRNADLQVLRPNKVRLSVTSADFRFAATGFDVNRQLIVDARTVP